MVGKLIVGARLLFKSIQLGDQTKFLIRFSSPKVIFSKAPNIPSEGRGNKILTTHVYKIKFLSYHQIPSYQPADRRFETFHKGVDIRQH